MIIEGATEIVANTIAKEAASYLWKAIVEKEHSVSLGNCSEAVKGLVKKGAEQAQDEKYDDAIRSFEEAAALDPTNVSVRIRQIKMYKQQGDDLTALVVAGGAINLATEPESRSQIFSFLGEISTGIFQLSKHLPHIMQAIAFYDQAINENPQNVVALWGRVHAYVLCQKYATDINIKEDSHRYAKNSLESLLSEGKATTPTPYVMKYWTMIVKDAQEADWWPDEVWWDEKRDEMKRIEKKVEILEDEPKSRKVEEKELEFEYLNRKKKIQKALIAASIILALLGWTAFPSTAKGMETRDATHIYTLYPKSDVGVEHDWEDLAAVEYDWKDLAEVEHDWNDLA